MNRVFALPVPPSPVFAHQGGWDEMLMVVGPLAVVGILLWLANKRVEAQLEQEAGSADHQGHNEPVETDEGTDGAATTDALG
jgi:cyanate permease